MEQAIINIVVTKKDGQTTIGTTVAGATSLEAIAYLEAAKFKLFADARMQNTQPDTEPKIEE